MAEEFWDEFDLDDLDVEPNTMQQDLWDAEEALPPAAPAPVAKKAAAVAPVPAAAAPKQDPAGKPVGPAGPVKGGGVPSKAAGGAAKATQNPQVPNLPAMPKMPAGMELPEFKTSKHDTDSVLDRYVDLLDRADTQEDEVSLNAVLAIADKWLAMAEFLGQKEIEQEQAKFQAQFDLILNAQKIAQQDAEHKLKLKTQDAEAQQRLKMNDQANKMKLQAQAETTKMQVQAQKERIAQQKADHAAAKKEQAAAKKATAAKKTATPKKTS